MNMSEPQKEACRGLRGVDHFGVTVPDMDEAVAFFADVLGCEEVFTIGPFRDDEGDFMATRLDVHPRAVIPRIKMLRCKNGANIELFEYEVSDQNPTPPRNSDIGGYHLAFYVDDISAAVEHLRSKNVRILGDQPLRMEEGANAGVSWVYFVAPWGMMMEFVSYPDGMAYEQGTGLRVWRPEPSAS
jgi:catechol 2,3-dioxygenase-like lactoylglutathione lyase family enzyme